MPCTVLRLEVEEHAAAGMGTMHMVCLVFVSLLLGAGICNMVMLHFTASNDVYGGGDQASDVWAAQWPPALEMPSQVLSVCMLTTLYVTTAEVLLVERLYAQQS